MNWPASSPARCDFPLRIACRQLPQHLVGPLWSARLNSQVVAATERATGTRGSTDRASDYGSEGWGFESLRVRSVMSRVMCDR